MSIGIRLWVALAALVVLSGASLACYLLHVELAAAFFGGQSSTVLVVLLDLLQASARSSRNGTSEIPTAAPAHRPRRRTRDPHDGR